MENKVVDEKILEQIKRLEKKFDAAGQDLSAHLEGLIHGNFLTYWDYINLDALLSLQSPKTHFPDEKTFITYHQITELYFSLIIHEQEQAIWSDSHDPVVFLQRVKRMNRYFDHLIDSFDVMMTGVDREQFLQFRQALIPSSGFQSVQYRKIEINSTDLSNLLISKERNDLNSRSPVATLFDQLYWKTSETATGTKTLALKAFEARYDQDLLEQARQTKENNLLRVFERNYHDSITIADELRKFDQNANMHWPMAHLQTTTRFLKKGDWSERATGGTRWEKYLNPENQKIRFFPLLWDGENQTQQGLHLEMD